jgi:hypothetical protein
VNQKAHAHHGDSTHDTIDETYTVRGEYRDFFPSRIFVGDVLSAP